MQEYQRQIKRGFKESHSAGNKRKMYQQYKEAVERGETEGVVVRLAREIFTPWQEKYAPWLGWQGRQAQVQH